VLARLAPEWASLPTQDGGSYYGQPVHSAAALRDFYQQHLQRQRRIEAERPPADLAIAQATI
jgi:lysozyme